MPFRINLLQKQECNRKAIKRQQSSIASNLRYLDKILTKPIFQHRNQTTKQTRDIAIKAPCSVQKINSKNDTQKHEIRNVNSALITKKQSSRNEIVKARNKIGKSQNPNINYIDIKKNSFWKQKKMVDLQKTCPNQMNNQNMNETASFYLGKGTKPIKYALKLQIKKYEIADLQKWSKPSSNNLKNRTLKYYPKMNVNANSPQSHSELTSGKCNMDQDIFVSLPNHANEFGHTCGFYGNEMQVSQNPKTSKISNQNIEELSTQTLLPPTDQRDQQSSFFYDTKHKIMLKKKNRPKLNSKLEKQEWFHRHFKLTKYPESVQEQCIDLLNFGQQPNLQHQDMKNEWSIHLKSEQDNFNIESRLKSQTAQSIQVSLFNRQNQNLTSLYCLNGERRVEIASLTKIMTCFLTLRICELFELDFMTQKLLVGEIASKMPGTSAQLNYSDTLTVHEAMHGLMLPSGNDAAVAIANWGGKMIRKHCQRAQKYLKGKLVNLKSLNFLNEYMAQKKSFHKLFIHHMNKCASSLKLHNTNFANTHGLMNSRAYSTARDLARITAIAMQNHAFRQIVKKHEFSCTLFNRSYSYSRKIVWRNTNKLLKIGGFIGVKTGVTPSAGPCLSSVYELSADQSIIIVVLKVGSLQKRFHQSLNLLQQCLQVMRPPQYHALQQKLRQKQEEQIMCNEKLGTSSPQSNGKTCKKLQYNSQEANLFKNQIESISDDNDIDDDLQPSISDY